MAHPFYVYHEIVHNTHVVDQFRNRGVVFVDEGEEVPVGSCLLYSAHGVSPDVWSKARARQLQTIDATCPLVAKVHVEAVKFAAHGDTIILIGHSGHDEAVGTIGQAPDQIILVESKKDVDQLSVSDPSRVAYITQTTLSSEVVADSLIIGTSVRF